MTKALESVTRAHPISKEEARFVRWLSVDGQTYEFMTHTYPVGQAPKAHPQLVQMATLCAFAELMRGGDPAVVFDAFGIEVKSSNDLALVPVPSSHRVPWLNPGPAADPEENVQVEAPPAEVDPFATEVNLIEAPAPAPPPAASEVEVADPDPLVVDEGPHAAGSGVKRSPPRPIQDPKLTPGNPQDGLSVVQNSTMPQTGAPVR